MSLTKTQEEKQAEIIALLQTKFLPLASQLTTFALKPSEESESYFVKRQHTQMTKADFQVASGIKDQETLAAAMRTMWEQREEATLAGIADDLAALAVSIKYDEEQSEELSPFVYAMY